MKILLVHNYYQQPGGEDMVFKTESELLQQHGHTVLHETVHNDATRQLNPLTLAGKTIWNHDVYRRFRELVRREKPDVAHFHNTFPLLSPSVYYAARHEGAAVVQTLHNYRLVCPGATLFREGRPCEDCLTRSFKTPALQHSCYRGSRAATLATTSLLGLHQAAGTWQNAVDAYIAISAFLGDKVIEGGLPAAKVHVKPNCLHPDPGLGQHQGGYALFLGRLSPEKGIATMLEAWRTLGAHLPLKIAGDGPLAPDVRRAVSETPGIEWLGQQDRTQVRQLLHDARCLILPSIWYEGGVPLTGLEALASGLPVISSRLGSMERHLEDRRTAILFTPGDPASLSAAVRTLLADPALERALAVNGRAEFERRFTAQRTYERLMEIYAASGARVSQPQPVAAVAS